MVDMRTLLLMSVFGAAACGGGEAAVLAVSRDSAGIRIVENQGQKWENGQGWRVPDTALVDIGGSRPDSAGDLDRVAGPVRLGDGRIAIANGGTNQVRVYGADGESLVTAGQTGNGPGEYHMPVGIWVAAGDSLLVFDAMLQRLSLVAPDGGFGRNLRLGGGAGLTLPTNGRFDFAVPVTALPDGSMVGVAQSFALNQQRPGRYRDSVTVMRYGADGTVRDTLGRFPGAEMETMTLTIGTQSMATPQPVPLGRQSVNAASGTRFYVAENNAWEIQVRGFDGALQSLIRVAAQPTPITPEDAEAHRKEQMEALEAQPAIRNLPDAVKSQVTARVRDAKYPETLPFLSALYLDPEGNLWATEVTRPGTTESRMAVIDSTGQLLGRVTLPARFRLTAIGSDRVYGVWKDADDVEHVRVYPLRKG